MTTYNYDRERALHPLLMQAQEAIKAYVLKTGDAALAWDMAGEEIPSTWESWHRDQNREVWDARPYVLDDLRGWKTWAASLTVAPDHSAEYAAMVAAIEAALAGVTARYQQERDAAQ